jgi:heme oxygenase (biliverdin-IX-beta and delta-forming)
MRSAFSSWPEPIKSAPQPGHARRSLRNETAILHEAVERHFAPGRMTRDAYIRYLMMNRPFASIEPALEAAHIHRILPDWDIRQRRFVLASDMHAMGISTGEPRAIAISDDIGTLLGWSYVLEGSRLGARFILKGIEATRDQELIGATRFLRHGAGMDLWTTFTAALSRIDNDPSAIESAGEAARAAFSCFKTVTESFDLLSFSIDNQMRPAPM